MLDKIITKILQRIFYNRKGFFKGNKYLFFYWDKKASTFEVYFFGKVLYYWIGKNDIYHPETR